MAYLRLHLKPLKVELSEVKKKLLKVETKMARDKEEEILTDSQNLLGNDMEVDFEDPPIEIDNPVSESRWEKEHEVNKVLSLTDEELFEKGYEIKEFVKQTLKYKQREKDFFLAKSDEDLFEMYDKLSPYIKRLDEFKQRHQEYVEGYMEENFADISSQEILLKLSQTPVAIQSSEAYRDRLCHLSFQDRSARLLLKTTKETITELKKTPEGRKQAKLFIAGVTHPVFGDPGLGLDERTRKEVKTIKSNLLTGTASTLKAEEHKKRSEFPLKVVEIAQKHWMENTIPEPAKHSGKALEVDGETVPTRYQDKTDRECYENFKEECQDIIQVEMAKAGQSLLKKLTNRPDSADKQRRLEYAQHLSET